MTAPRLASGVALAVSSSLAFGTSGTIVKPLLASGWTPAAAVTARVLLAAVVLAIPAAIALRGRFRMLWRARTRILLFAVFAVAGTQLGYFAAVQRIPVSTALLIEYLAPVVLVLIAWARTRRRPAVVVLAGAALAVLGLVLVIGTEGLGRLDPLGVLFAALAAVGLGVYFVLAARTDDGTPPLAMTASSLLVGGLILAAFAGVGILPFATSTAEVALAGVEMPWFVPVIAVALVSTAFAYTAGITGAGRLGARLASFLGLLEVVFASGFSWLLLGETLGAEQLLGAVFILGGVMLIRFDARTVPEADAVVAGTEPLPIRDPFSAPPPR
ncbi:MAG: DMT family transporter [Micrococcales bacterium]|nr:DMT family transporter [Micrococcales bacterium]